MVNKSEKLSEGLLEYEIQQFIKEMIAKYRRKRILKGLVLGILSAFILIFMTYFLRIYFTFQISAVLILFLMTLPIGIGLILAVVLPIPVRELIAAVDRKIEFEEMLITYYEYSEQKGDNPYLQLLKNRLVSFIENKEITDVFKVNIHREIRIIVIILVSFIFLTIWIDFSGVYQTGSGRNNLSPVMNEEDSFVEYQSTESSRERLEQPGQVEEEFRREFPEISASSPDFQPDNLSEVEVDDEFDWDEQELEKGESTITEQSDDYSSEERESSESSEEGGEYRDLSDENQTEEESESSKNQTEDGIEEDSERSEERSEDSSQSDEEGERPEQSREGEGSRPTDRSDQNEQEEIDDTERDSSDLSEEPGTGSSESNRDDFQSLDQDYEGSRLKSGNESNYYNRYVEEFMRPDIEGSESGLSSEEMNSFRDFIINSLEDERIPANYRDMVRDYFNKIIQE
ncbi:MAG: hypothetical protein ACLFPF_02860 [Halanaerobiales bacterium]